LSQVALSSSRGVQGQNMDSLSANGQTQYTSMIRDLHVSYIFPSPNAAMHKCPASLPTCDRSFGASLDSHSHVVVFLCLMSTRNPLRSVKLILASRTVRRAIRRRGIVPQRMKISTCSMAQREHLASCPLP